MQGFQVRAAAICALVFSEILFTRTLLADVQGNCLTVQATNAGGTGTMSWDWSRATFNSTTQTWSWSQSSSVPIKDPNGLTLATVTSASIQVRLDQLYTNSVTIGVVAGSTDTLFVISTSLANVDFVPSSLATAKASASFTVTDQNNNGAVLVGANSGAGGAFMAYVDGAYPQGAQFSNLVGTVAASAGGTATGSQSDPPIGYRPVGADLTSMNDRLYFTLTAGDRAYASTSFTAPEPPPCPGDLNHDYIVDFTDLTIALQSFGTCTGDPHFKPELDVDHDGCITLSDYSAEVALYGSSCR